MNSVTYYKEKYFELLKNNNLQINKEIINCFNEKTLEKLYSKLIYFSKNFVIKDLLEFICEELLVNISYKVERSRMKLGLYRMEEILKSFGNPEKDLKVIHIAGTNGKGSVSSYIKKTLSKKYKVGMYSSPAMLSINDRIRIGDTFITHQEMYEIYKDVENKWYNIHPNSDDNISFFEILTVVAILYFKKNNVDFVIMEVGLGGRFDATNIFKNKLISVITKIGLDHTNILGDTLEKIAYEKAGIIEKNDNVILYPANKSVENVFLDYCSKKNAKIEILDINEIKINKINRCNSIFSYNKYKNIKIKMLGKHQIYNAALAIMTLVNLLKRNIIDLTAEELISGIENTVWAGRLEWLGKNILLDGAHNIDGAKSLVNYLKTQKITKLKILLGILTDKDYKEMIKIFEQLKAEFYITKVPIELKNSSIEELKNSFKKNVNSFETYEDATRALYYNLKDDEVLVVTGSLYLIAAVRRKIIEKMRLNNE